MSNNFYRVHVVTEHDDFITIVENRDRTKLIDELRAGRPLTIVDNGPVGTGDDYVIPAGRVQHIRIARTRHEAPGG